MEEFTEPMEINYRAMNFILGDHKCCLLNDSTSCYACQDKYNLVKALVSN